MAERPQAGMEVDDTDLARLAQLLAGDGADGAIAPGLFAAAIEDAVGMGVLPTADRALQAVGAVLLGIGVEHALGLGLARFVPLLGQDGVGDGEIAFVLRIGLVVID